MSKFSVLFLGCLFFMSSCGDDSTDQGEVITLGESTVSLTYEETYQLRATSKKEITYSSENEFNAFVDQDGLITANKVGTTNIILKNGDNTANVEVKVQPKSNFYEEPTIVIGTSKAEIIKKMGTPSTTNASDNSITYLKDLASNPQIQYFFTQNDKLETVKIRVVESGQNDLSHFLFERYQYSYADYMGLPVYINSLTKETATLAIKLEAKLGERRKPLVVDPVLYWDVTYISPLRMPAPSSLEIKKDMLLQPMQSFIL